MSQNVTPFYPVLSQATDSSVWFDDPDVIALGFMQTTVMEMGQSAAESAAAPAISRPSRGTRRQGQDVS